MTTLTKEMLAKDLVDKMGLSQRDAKCLVEAFLEEVSATLASGKNVKFSGFGNFILRDKGARPGRNPKTGEVVTIAPRRVVVFRPGRKLKEKIVPQDERSES